ncbi:MAG TPA: SWIM zinc finger family protein, partial [Propionibacteriaceae bacterium]|nr:SWIM zinc finger family protein [Propionibacteriaceae bacterium]
MVETERHAGRAERVAAGLNELDQWLRDQVRTGIAELGRGGYGPLDRMAARMVDAQAPGVAGMLRGLPGELAGEDWPARLLEQLGALHLLIAAHRWIEELPAD